MKWCNISGCVSEGKHPRNVYWGGLEFHLILCDNHLKKLNIAEELVK